MWERVAAMAFLAIAAAPTVMPHSIARMSAELPSEAVAMISRGQAELEHVSNSTQSAQRAPQGSTAGGSDESAGVYKFICKGVGDNETFSFIVNSAAKSVTMKFHPLNTHLPCTMAYQDGRSGSVGVAGNCGIAAGGPVQQRVAVNQHGAEASSYDQGQEINHISISFDSGLLRNSTSLIGECHRARG